MLAFAAALIAGALNSVAGGGSFVSFPVLLFLGLPPIVANATNNTAMWLGTLSSVGGYREELGRRRRRFIPALAVASAGGALGAVLLLVTPEATFTRMIPYLLLFATVLFAASDRLRELAGRSGTPDRGVSARLFLPLFAVAIYGGYFGAGVSILILALFALSGWSEIHRMNAVKALLTACINGVAVLPFAVAGKIAWDIGAVAALGAAAGGYFGARIARRVEPHRIRLLVIVVGAAMTIYFFIKTTMLVAVLAAPVVRAEPAPLVVPFELVDGHVFVDVRVNGAGPFRMAVDTGAGNTIARDVAEQLHLKSGAPFDVYGTGEHAEQARTTRVATVEIAGATLRDQGFTVLPFAGLREAEGTARFDGLLGHELFERYVVQIDYARRMLTLYEPHDFEHGPGLVVPFTLHGGTPEVAGKVDGIDGRFTIDTGDRGSLSLTAPFVAAHHLVERYGPAVEGISGWGIGGPVRAYMTRVPRLEFGGVVVDRPVTRLSEARHGFFASGSVAGNIGYGVFSRFLLTVDYARKQLTFDTSADGAGTDVYDRSGMWLVRRGDRFSVVDVIAGGPAAEAGVHAGDAVVAVDDRAAPELALASVRETLRGAPGTSVSLRLLHENAVREVTLVLRDLL
jgi:uncharacterized membrane protein YfcA